MSKPNKCLRELSNSEKQVRRIRLIRRNTQIVKKPGENNSNENDTFISQILLIQLKPREEASEQEISALNGCETHFLPYIAYSYPSAEGQMNRYPPSLFYPDFTCPWRTDHSRKECGTFTVILTDERCNRSFAYCYKFRLDEEDFSNKANVLQYDDDLRNPFYFIGNCVLVLVSHYPAEQVLMSIASDSVIDLKRKRKSLEDICKELMLLEVSTSSKTNINSNLRVRDQDQKIESFTIAPLSDSIQRLGIETTVYIFMSLLAEKRILVTGENVKIVSDTVQMFSRLLAPIQWPHVLIPVIPDTLIDLVQNPTPYLCGTMRHNLHKLNRLFNITAINEDIIIVDAALGIFSPQLEFNKIGKKEKLQILIEHGRKMGFSKKMIVDLVKFLESVFPYRDAEKASFNIQNRIMVWYAKNFGHYKSKVWPCAASLLSAKNKKIFAKMHPVHETRDFLHWFCESGIFQNFVYGALENKYHDPIYTRFEKILKQHSPPLKAGGAKNAARRYVYKFWHR